MVLVRLVLTVAVAAVASPAFAADESMPAGRPLTRVYDRGGAPLAGAATAEYELAFGSRQTAFMSGRGIEQIVRGRYSPTGWLFVEAQAGFLATMGDDVASPVAAQVDVSAQLLDTDGEGIDLTLAAGYRRDYLARNLPRLRLTVGRSFGDVDISLWGLAEFPIGGEEEEEEEEFGGEEEEGEIADLVAGFAASWAMLDRLAIGAEVVGEDLEGFFEEEENEGGARLLAGPSAWARLADHVEMKIYAGPVVSLTNNTPLGGEAAPARVGVMARSAFSYNF